jgi:S-adenosylmethionine-diacylglycerol 3-amino-3-carboxypropyl transferase
MSEHATPTARFDFVRYASVWEDADVLCEALAPVAQGGRLLSIASAGDNVLALLTLDPAAVVAVDLNPAQLACLELRIAALRRLADPDLIAFLGLERAEDRWTTYQRLRVDLPESAAAFWDARPKAIRGGVIHAGKFERYLRMFRRCVLPLIHPERTIQALLEPRDREGRERFYRGAWDTPRWRMLFRLFFGRAMLGRVGRDPAFLKHVDGPVADRLLDRTSFAFTELQTHTNPYLSYMVRGTYPSDARPRYLRPEWLPAIRERLDRVQAIQGPVHEVDEGGFRGFNLSDVFEYLSPEEHYRAYDALLERAAPGARLVYWNLLAPRGCPSELRKRVEPLEAAARELHLRDRAWFYSALHVDEVSA